MIKMTNYNFKTSHNGTNSILVISTLILVASLITAVTAKIPGLGISKSPEKKGTVDSKFCRVYRDFDKGFKSVSVTEGETLKVFCTLWLLNLADVTMTWSKDGKELNLTALAQEDSRVEIDPKNLDLGFNIRNVNKSDVGVYGCTAKLIDERALNLSLSNKTCPQNSTSRNDYIWVGKPGSSEFLVRVKGSLDFLLPLYIIIGQCLLLGLITGFCHWREKKKEEQEKETPFEDKYKPIHSDSDSE